MEGKRRAETTANIDINSLLNILRLLF